MAESSTKYINADRLVFSGSHRSHDSTFHIFSQNSDYITFNNNVKTDTIDANNVKSLNGDDMFSYENDTIKFKGAVDFNNQTLSNMTGMSNLYSNQINSSNINDTLDKEMDNLTISVNNNTGKVQGLTANKIMRSNNSGTLQTGTIDTDELLLNNITTDQNILGNLHFAENKHIKYNGTQLNHTHLDGFDTVQDQIDLNTAKIGITTQQAQDIVDNNNTTGITSQQTSDITTNNNKTGITTQQASDITTNNNKTGITTQQASDITTNNAKTGITTQQAQDIVDNNNKTGISTTQANNITTNNAKISFDNTASNAVDVNTAKVGITSQQASDITTNNNKRSFSTSYQDTVDEYGLEIGVLDVGKVNKASPAFTGLNDGICKISSNNLTTGTLATGDIPDLASSKITSGTLDVARIPDIDASKIISGTVDSSRIPSLATSKITSGTFSDARLGSNVMLGDVSETISGLKQCSNGIVGGTFSSGIYSVVSNSGSISLQNTSARGILDFNYQTTGLRIQDNDDGDLEILGGDLNIQNGNLQVAGSAISTSNLSDADNLMLRDASQFVSGYKQHTAAIDVVTVDTQISLKTDGRVFINKKTGDENPSLTFNSASTNVSFTCNSATTDIECDTDFSLDTGKLYKINGTQITTDALSDESEIVKTSGNQSISGLKTFSSDINITEDSGANKTKISSVGEIELKTDGTDTNAIVNMLTDDHSSTLECDKTNNCITINDNISIDSGKTYQINNAQINTTNLSNGSNIVFIDSSQTITGAKTFNSQINVNDSGNINNLSILHNDGRLYMRNVDNGSSFVQMISNNHSCKLSSDESTGTLIIDNDVNLASGKIYKIDNTQIASSNLSNDSNIAKLDALPSTLMYKPNFWIRTVAQSIKIMSTTHADSELFDRADAWYNTTTAAYEEIPDDDEGDYTVHIKGETVSSEYGIYQFRATFNFIVGSSTNSSLVEYELPLTGFAHATTHGQPSIIFKSGGSNNWNVYLIFSSVGVNDQNDIMEYTLKLRKNYWG